jgi:hypothetical protein
MKTKPSHFKTQTNYIFGLTNSSKLGKLAVLYHLSKMMDVQYLV